MRPVVVAFVASSGSGKTTLIEQLIGLACAQGLRVGALKHDAHRFDIDHPGKDSYRFTAAGAAVTLLAADDKLALVRRHETCPPVRQLIDDYLGDLDLVLVEGWQSSELPRIEVHRPELGRPLMTPVPQLIAVAANGPVGVNVPVLDLDDPAAILTFIRERFDLNLPGG